MNFTNLPARIQKTFSPVAIARIGARSNKNGSFITVTTTKGGRFRFEKVAESWLPESVVMPSCPRKRGVKQDPIDALSLALAAAPPATPEMETVEVLAAV